MAQTHQFTEWNSTELGKWIDCLVGNDECGRKFILNHLEGWMLPHLTYEHIYRELSIRKECAARIFHAIQSILYVNTNLVHMKLNSEVLNGIYEMENDVLDTRMGLVTWLDSLESCSPGVPSENRAEECLSIDGFTRIEDHDAQIANSSKSRDQTRRHSTATHFISLGIWAPRLRQVAAFSVWSNAPTFDLSIFTGSIQCLVEYPNQ